jgi:iron-sulfur cluster assembly protein
MHKTLFYASNTIFASMVTTDIQTATSAPISITSGAMTQLRRLMQEQNIPEGYGLRVGVKGGGCSGFSYLLGFDVQKEKDQIYDIDGLHLFIEKSHAMYLIGMSIDWHDDLNNRGFVFENPNATSTCGCGTSFSA